MFTQEAQCAVWDQSKRHALYGLEADSTELGLNEIGSTV